jgi:hypothetical protein
MFADRWRRAAPFMFCVLLRAASAAAQGADPHAGHNMAAMEEAIPESREGSGTSWLPDESPMRAIHAETKGWTLMTHFNAFVQYLHESGDRGSSQGGSINWLMAMAERSIGAGSFRVRGMISVEPFTIGGCGYPDLLATGESCDSAAIHDRQHPHDLVMEAAVQYDRPLSHGVRLQVYGGPAGEPALGPVAFMHRVSAFANPIAPIAHHWLDSTHITYGVATAGVYSSKWKIEGSAFNGREPDADRVGFDFAAMDSWSTRFWFMPSSHWALQASGGRLHEAEAGHDGEEPIDVDRITASASYHRPISGGLWSTTIAWGRNQEAASDATNALLAETTLSPGDRHAVYGRLEWVEKTAHDLAVDGDAIYTVAKMQAGYTFFTSPWKKVAGGIGAAASVGVVPHGLERTYGGRFNPGVSVYLNLMPAAMRH